MSTSKENQSEETKTDKKPELSASELHKQEHIGIHTRITLGGFNGERSIPAKVDTGAETSSLHASSLNVTTNNATSESTAVFTFGDSKYRIPVAGFQSVSTSDGVTNRPTVKFGVYINAKFVPDVVFNLNDRSNMEFPVLIGLNLINAAKLKVDPALKEMEIEFSVPVDGQDSEPAPDSFVDTSADSTDDNSDEQFLNWFKANRDKTIAEVFAQLYKGNQQDVAV